MSRAALLPTPGDPFIIAAWLNHYKKVWAKEIDKLYIHLNSRLEEPVMNYVKQICLDAGADVTYTCAWMGHGEALRIIFDKCNEDHIFLIEDDAYIFHPTVVSQCFERVESGAYDAVVTTRGSCSESIRLKEAEYWGLKGDLWYKPNFWPCFFFSKKETLAPCQNLATWNVPTGTFIKELNWTTPENISMDTFGQASIELRARNLRFLCLEDGRATTQDLFLFPQKQGIFADPPVAPWIHFGSTSSGISNSLLDDKFMPLENRLSGQAPTKLPTIPDDHIKDDYERRISLWQLSRTHFPITTPEASYFNDIYQGAIDRIIDGCGLNRDRFNTYLNIYTQALAPMWNK